MRKSKLIAATTLVELLFYVLIVSIVSIILANIAYILEQNSVRNQVVLQTTQHAESAMDLIVYYLDSASVITTPSLGNSSASIDLISNGQSVQIYLAANQLFADIDGNTYALTSNSFTATALSFENKGLSYDSIRASFTLSTFSSENLTEKNYTYTTYGTKTNY